MDSGKKGSDNSNNLLSGIKKNSNLFPIINSFVDCLIVILDTEGKLKYYNRYAENITGIPLETACGQYYWDIFCRPEEKELYKAFFFSLDSSQYPLNIKAQISGKSNSNYTVSWKYSTLEETESGVIYYVLTGINLTNYEETNKALREISEKYRTIIHVSPVSVITVDTAYKITSWSSAAEKLLGWTESNVLDKKLFLFFDDRRNLLKEYCNKAVQGKITNDLEITCRRKDESLVHISMFLAPMRDYNGAVTGIVIIALDISARKKAETELRESEKMLRYLSYHDTLTGVHNRTYYEKEIEKIKNKEEYPTALILIDIDDLKLVNDSLGHDAGDRYLKASAALIENNLRDSDLLARIGGDEFVIVLPRSGRKKATMLADRIRLAVDNYNRDLPELPIGLSIGLSVCKNRNQSFEDTFRSADSAMYEDKTRRNKENRLDLVKAIFKLLNLKDLKSSITRSRIRKISKRWGQEIGLEEQDILRLLSEIDEQPIE